MSHGIMGIGSKGFASMAGFTAFFAYLGQSFRGPDQPKFIVDSDIAHLVHKTQPGIVPEYYIKKK